MSKVLNYDWQNKKVLVTGASGFKGSWLCRVLSELGAEVYGTARETVHPHSAYHLLKLDGRIVKVTADVSERQQVFDVLNSISPDVVFHLAAKALVPVAKRDPLRAFDVNIMGPINILEGCRQLGVGQVVLMVSTDHVFGRIRPDELPSDGFKEDARVSYGGPYDTSKSAMELCIRSYHYTYWSKLPAIGITRAANVFGFGDVGQRRVVPLFVASAVGKTHTIPLRFLSPGRQFIYMSDVITGYVKAASLLAREARGARDTADRPERTPFTPTFHFSLEQFGKYQKDKEPFIRMAELARLTKETLSKKGDVKINRVGAIDFPPDENPIQAMNCEHTREKLGWEAKVTMEDGIGRLGNWYTRINRGDDIQHLMDTEVRGIVESLNDDKNA